MLWKIVGKITQNLVARRGALMFAATLAAGLMAYGVASAAPPGGAVGVPAGQCTAQGGSWVGAAAAQGRPEAAATDKNTLDYGNAAVWQGGNGTLTCGGFDVPDGERITRPAISFSLATGTPDSAPAQDTRTPDTPSANIFAAARAEPIARQRQAGVPTLDGLLKIVVSHDNGKSWRQLYVLDGGEQSNGYFSVALPKQFVRYADNLQVRLEGLRGGDIRQNIYIDSVFLTYQPAPAQELSLVPQREQSTASGGKPVFARDAPVSFRLEPHTAQGLWGDFAAGMGKLLKTNGEPHLKLTAALAGAHGGESPAAQPKITWNGSAWQVEIEQPSAITPGLHTLQIEAQDAEGNVQTVQQDFLWGVLAVNTHKSAYQSGDTVNFDMAVLDERGMMVCDADVTLQIDGPQQAGLSIESGDIEVSDECSSLSVTEQPDYSASWQVPGQGSGVYAGDYEYTLTAKTANGTYSIADSFKVEPPRDALVERRGHTRIMPAFAYTMAFDVTPQRDFSGTVTETVPIGFELSNHSAVHTVNGKTPIPADVQITKNEAAGTQQLSWHVDLEKGQTYRFSYDYDAPDKSPEFYSLGPLTFKGNGFSFAEPRQWQIASDAPGVQRGSATISSSTTASQTISSVDTGKTFVIASANGGSSASDVGHVMPVLTSSTNIDFMRYSTTSTATNIRWEVIEMDDATVQRNTQTVASGAAQVDVNITAVDLSKSFIIVNSRINTNTTAQWIRGEFRASFVDADTIRLTRGQTGTDAEVHWQVVTLDNASVQSGSVQMSSTGSATDTLTTVDTSQSLLMFSKASDNTGLAMYSVRGQISDANTVSFNRTNATGNAWADWFVVEHPQFNVQRGQTSVSGGSAVTQAVTSLDLGTSFMRTSWDSTGTGTSNANAQLTYHLSSASQMTFQKATASNTNVAEWQAAEILPADPGVPSAPTLHSSDGTNQIAFNNIRQNSTTPTFRASATHTASFDRFQLELNTAADFSGTSYTQTFSGTYASGTQYNLTADSLSPSLPTTDGVTYYTRVCASADSGSTWGDWASAAASGVQASGGDNVYDLGGYRYHEFTTPGSANLSVSSDGEIEYLIVGGGGGGGVDDDATWAGGGGGAGGVITDTTTLTPGTYPISVGSGGAGGTNGGSPSADGTSGGDSTAFGLTAVGGGFGGGFTGSSNVGGTGGSGGGSAGGQDGTSSGTAGQGNGGGGAGGSRAGGGGGGASTAGGNGSDQSTHDNGGPGGDGVSVWGGLYDVGGGGGGGGTRDAQGVGGAGGLGGGGTGANPLDGTPAQPGADGTGGGGGGGGGDVTPTAAREGGSGVVVARYIPSDAWSYTYKAASETPDWFQTADAQFNTGTLSGTQTTGSGSVEISSGGGSSAVREFDGVNDIINLDPGGTASIDGGPITVAAWVKPDSNTQDLGLLEGRNSSNPQVFNIYLGGDVKIYGGTGNFTGFSSFIDGGWQLMAYSKPNGSGSTVRVHLYNPATQTWTHGNGGTGDDEATPVIQVRLGEAFGAFFRGRLAVAGVWSSELSDGAIEAAGLETSLANWTSSGAAAVWPLNQANVGDGVTDATGGGADETSVTGTAVITNDAPSGFNLGGSTITSPAIDFDYVPGAGNWDQIAWSEDETNGSISMQVHYTSSTTCDTIVPDGALSGNSSGFGTSPIDISGLNTTTYNEICLRATLTDSGGSPFLQDWSVSWGSSNNAPNAPASLVQRKTDDAVLATGDWTNETSVEFAAQASDTDNPENLQLCIEVDELGTAFSGTEDSCGSAVAYSGSAVAVEHTIALSSPDGKEYHWQARIKDDDNAYSSWVSYPTPTPNAESARDFGVDTSAPTGGTVYDGTSTGVDANFNDGSLTQLSANWSGFNFDASGAATNPYEYSIGTTQGGTDIAGWTSLTGVDTDETALGLTLQTSNIYYFNVRATDAAGNQTVVSSDGQFVLPSLSFSASPTSVTFDNLNAGNSYTDSSKTTTLTTSTNAYGGYAVRARATDLLKTAGGSFSIPWFTGGTYASPAAWGGSTGFGYTSSDTTIGAGETDKFGSGTLYAPFTTTAPGDVVADHVAHVTGSTGAISNEQATISYRVTTDASQASGNYNSTIIYIVTAEY